MAERDGDAGVLGVRAGPLSVDPSPLRDPHLDRLARDGDGLAGAQVVVIKQAIRIETTCDTLRRLARTCGSAAGNRCATVAPRPIRSEANSRPVSMARRRSTYTVLAAGIRVEHPEVRRQPAHALEGLARLPDRGHDLAVPTPALELLLDRPWRHAKVTERRTAADFAKCMRDLADRHFPEAELIRVVLRRRSMRPSRRK
jgi:hypothetical protein